mgnify:CR=1 FL=1
MSWWAIGALAGGAYAFKALGMIVVGGRGGRARGLALTAFIPPALFAALVAVQTLDGGERLVLDARVLGVAAAAVAVWRKAPFVFVLGVAMAVTALARAAI